MPGCQIVARLRKLSPIRLVNVFAFQLPQLFAAVFEKLFEPRRAFEGKPRRRIECFNFEIFCARYLNLQFNFVLRIVLDFAHNQR